MKTSAKLIGIVAIAVCSTSANAQFFQGLMDSIKNAKDAIVSSAAKNTTEDPAASLVNPNKAVSKVVMAYSSGATIELEDGIKNGTTSSKDISFPASKVAGAQSICSFPATTVTDLRESFRDASALLLPVYKLRRANVDSKSKSKLADFGLDVDWGATEKLHKSMTKSAGIRLLPLSETKRFDSYLQQHLTRTLLQHFDAIYKSMGSDGGLLPMLAAMNEGKDASDVNKQIAGPFNEDFYANVLKNFEGASYLISTADSKIVTAYFSSLIHNLAGSADKFPVPRGNDLTEIRMIQSIWNSYLASYGYLVGDATQKEAESAAIGSGSRLLKITSESWIKQWKVLAPELAAAGQVLDTHAIARANHVGLLSITPIEVFSKMSALGFNSTKLQCVAYNTNTLASISKAGETALKVWNDVDKESNPIFGHLTRGYQGTQPGEDPGHGCVGWGCPRATDLVKDKRINELITSLNQMPAEKQIVDASINNELLVDALAFTMSANDISGAIGSSKLK